ncbi:MAG: DNA repair protein RecO C-terminal domain-containing protein [Duncaniella sp.]|nr:DNA repair protein RecO C-terminal domain-containing protein [Duncaniella sp.]
MPQLNVNMIALRLTRHSDRQSILTAYSREAGRLSIAIPAGTGRGAARIQALTMPLSLLQGVVDARPGREIVNVKGLQLAEPLHSLHSHPVKQMTGMFLAEVLASVLRDNEGDPVVWSFIESSVKVLDSLVDSKATANFHLWFLYRLGALMGIEPDVSTYTDGSLLDLRDGLWRRSPALHGEWLDKEESRAVWLLSRMTIGNMHLYRFSRTERNRILDGMTDYYSAHLVSLHRLKSLDVLRMML